MAVFEWFKRKPKVLAPNEPLNPHWARAADGRYFRLSILDTSLPALAQSGIYVIWHVGLIGKWVWVDQAEHLGQAIDHISGEDDILRYYNSGSLIVTWSPIAVPYQQGVLLYLHDNMKPELDNPIIAKLRRDDVLPVPVQLPGK